MSFDKDKCPTPCERFVRGVINPDNDMVQCGTCGMWFVDDDSLPEFKPEE